jgi:hypothetical protein
MREYSPTELDLMAKAYERAYDRLSMGSSLAPDDREQARLSLVSGIVEAIDQGERDEDVLVTAALSKI